MDAVWILQPRSRAAFNYTDWFSSPAVRRAAPFNSGRTETSERRQHNHDTMLQERGATTKTWVCKQLGEANAAYHTLFSYSVDHRAGAEVHGERRSRWRVFLVARETQR